MGVMGSATSALVANMPSHVWTHVARHLSDREVASFAMAFKTNNPLSNEVRARKGGPRVALRAELKPLVAAMAAAVRARTAQGVYEAMRVAGYQVPPPPEATDRWFVIATPHFRAHGFHTPYTRHGDAFSGTFSYHPDGVPSAPEAHAHRFVFLHRRGTAAVVDERPSWDPNLRSWPDDLLRTAREAAGARRSPRVRMAYVPK